MASSSSQNISETNTNITVEKKTVIHGITIDCVIFSFDKKNLEVLLVQHAGGASVGKWGLLGGDLYLDESIDNAALRIVYELTSLDNIYLEQLKAFTDPDRVKSTRVITVGYYTLLNREDYDIKASISVIEAKWYKIKDIPDLICLLYTSPSPRDRQKSRMPSSA